MTQNIRTIQRRMGEHFAFADAAPIKVEKLKTPAGYERTAHGTLVKKGPKIVEQTSDRTAHGRKLTKSDADDTFSKGDRVKINAPGLPGHGKTGKILGKHSDHYQIQSGPDDNKNWMHPASRLTRADGDGDWNIKQLYDALKKDLTQCHTGSEKAMCKAIGGKEIRETAERLAKTRKLTPGEVAIAQEFGYRG